MPFFPEQDTELKTVLMYVHGKKHYLALDKGVSKHYIYLAVYDPMCGFYIVLLGEGLHVRVHGKAQNQPEKQNECMTPL